MGPFVVNQKVQERSKLACETVKEKVSIVIERGVENGHKILLKGKGDQIPSMLPADVELTVDVRSHETFKRRGHDLYVTQHVSLKDALLGFETTITHLDDRVITIGSPENEILRPRQEIVVKGEGMPHHNTPSSRGDMYVKIHFDMPSYLDPSTRKWLRENFPES